GIRDGHVTGVQTCALPIFADVTQLGTFFLRQQREPLQLRLLDGGGGVARLPRQQRHRLVPEDVLNLDGEAARLEHGDDADREDRSEERRVGKGWSSWGWGA